MNEKTITDIFQMLDRNGDGKISMIEVQLNLIYLINLSLSTNSI